MESPQERFIQVVRWYLSAFHAGRKSSVAKKPYNPILGETFKCHWDVPNYSLRGSVSVSSLNVSREVSLNVSREVSSLNVSREVFSQCVQRSLFLLSMYECLKYILLQETVKDGPVNDAHPGNLTFIAEQVSHHPPISAFYAEHVEKRIMCSAHIYTKSRFLGLSIGVNNIGQGSIYLLDKGEEYIVTFPSAYGRSILTVPWVELGGSVSITCPQTGYTAAVEFLTKVRSSF